jgi:hypothetical protein
MKQIATNSRRWLCIAYAFPPINRSGTHRTLGFVRELDRLGWRATVVTVRPDGEHVDQTLSRSVPAGTDVVRTGWSDWHAAASGVLRRRTPSRVVTSEAELQRLERRARRSPSFRSLISQFLTLPDSRIGWLIPGVRAALTAGLRSRAEVVFSTSPYMTAHLIALCVSRMLGRPWVADFRDPWRGNPFRAIGHPLADRIDAWLERLVMHNATHVVTCSPTMTDQMRFRFPQCSARTSTILNAFDADHLHGITPVRPFPEDCFVLTHAGQFYGARDPIPLLQALVHHRRVNPALAERLRLVFIGPSQFDGRYLYELASDHGVADMIYVPGRKSHRETLNWLAGSDAVLLAAAGGAGADLQIPNKLYEYLALKRPIVALCSRDNPIRDILDEAGALCTFADARDVSAISFALAQAPSLESGNTMGAWSGVGRFNRSRRAVELVTLFDRLVKHSRHRRARAAKPVVNETVITKPEMCSPAMELRRGRSDVALSSTS